MSKKRRKRKRKLHRDAVTGKFVSSEYVEQHPDTTVTETVGVKSPKMTVVGCSEQSGILWH